MKNTYEYWSRACADHALHCPHCGAAIDVAALVRCLMGEKPSMYDDETVCAKCVKP